MSSPRWTLTTNAGVLMALALCCGGLAACSSSDAESCASAADCSDGFICRGATPTTPGVCSSSGACVYDFECGTGFVCTDDGACAVLDEGSGGNTGGGGGGGGGGGADTCTSSIECATGFECRIPTGASVGVCLPIEGGGGDGDCLVDSDCPAAYTCDVVSSTCFERCTEAAFQCRDGYQCEGADAEFNIEGVCVQSASAPYSYVIITSEVPPGSDEVQDTNTPGPDIDTVELISGNVVLRPTLEAGVLGDSFDNSATSFGQIIGRDSMVGDGPIFDCDVTSGYVSLGDSSGFVALSFSSTEILSGDVVLVYEISQSSCPFDVGTNWSDAYAVYVHDGDIPVTAAAVRAAACAQGESRVDGGFTSIEVDLERCD